MSEHSFVRRENNENKSSISSKMQDYPMFIKIMDNFDYLKEDEDKQKVFENAIETVGNFSVKDSKQKKSILVVGKVQSGKTTNFTGVTTLAIELGMDITVVLGGTNSALLNQNYERLKETITSDNIKIYSNKDIQNSEIFTSRVVMNQLKKGVKCIFVIMKETSNLKKIVGILDRSIASGKNLLIVDDEADLASVSNNTKTSTINSLIKTLYMSCVTSTYVAYTATPQANIMTKNTFWQSPSYINHIIPHESYCGLRKFHGTKKDNLIIISDELREPIEKFILDAFIIKYKSNYKKTIDMILHIERTNEDNEGLYNRVNDIVVKIFKDIKNKKDNNIFNFYKEYISGYIKEYDLFFDYAFENCRDIKRPIKFYDPKTHRGNRSLINKGHINVIIGSDMLGRGVTFNNLSTIILKETQKFNIDTMLQRARWFGYREEKLFKGYTFFDFSKVYTTEVIDNVFSIIKKSDDALWECLKYLKNTIKIKNYKKVNIPIVGTNDVLPTNKKKMGEDVTKEVAQKVFSIKLKNDTNVQSGNITFSKLKKILGLYTEDINKSLMIISYIVFTNIKIIRIEIIGNNMKINVKKEDGVVLYARN